MKLKDLIGAFASEIERSQAEMERNLEDLAKLEIGDPAFLDALEQYSGETQRMGEAADYAGFPGLQHVCQHVLENCLMLAAKAPDERIAMINFLHDWPPLIVHYLRNLSDPSSAAGLIDYLEQAPYPLDPEEGLKIMHMLGALPLQAGLASEDEKPHRPVLATPEDVELSIPEDVDRNFLEGFFQEAPEQAGYLLKLARNLASGEGDSSDIIAAKRVCHTLKGSGYTIGLRGLAALGHHLEDILDYCETQGGKLPQQVANVLLDSAYCIEQMINYLTGSDDFPQQAQATLQSVLDLANRIDAGESLEVQVSRAVTAAPASADADAPRPPAPKAADKLAPRTEGPSAMATQTLRVNKQNVEDLFLISSEMSVGNAAMEARIKTLVDSSRELLSQNLRVQKRMLELETILQMRTLTRKHSRDSSAQAGFDQLEMDQYNELHSTTNALVEEVADSRTLASKLEEDIAQAASQQTRQQRLSKDLQYLVLGTRMTEVGVLESRLQRNVRSTCQATGKEAVLTLEGGNTMIDTELLNKLAEPLLHLLRNAVDHGLEMPEQREAAGKPRAGRVLLNFSRQGQQVVLRCQDDGRGLNIGKIREIAAERGLIQPNQPMSEDEVTRLILLPGFSTRREVSEVSGRGVGLDVVHEWVTAINGTIHIQSRLGEGCLFELRFSATLSTMPSLVVEAGGQRFALPTVQVVQAVARGVGEFNIVGENTIFQLGKRTYPAFYLSDLVGIPVPHKPLEEQAAVIIKVGNRAQVLIVDHLVDARELLLNNPGRYARHLRGVAGLSILGDGSVAVNLDLAQLFAGGVRRLVSAPSAANANIEDNMPKVLIVDDSLSVRNSLSQLIKDSGFRAETARDGLDAIHTMDSFKPDVVLTDLEMPNMNGVELSYHIRERADTKNLPIIMITSRSQEKHRRMAEQAGVSAYITKPYNDDDLVQAIRRSVMH
jgi:chemotaxis protein histidine kinase CheA/CheY-like chemotaxis protein